MDMRFPAKKNAGCPKAPPNFPPRKYGILYPRRVDLGLPSPSHRVCADGRTDGRTDGRADVRTYGRMDGRSRDYYVTTKISWIDRLTNFLSNGAPLAGFARRLRYNSNFFG